MQPPSDQVRHELEGHLRTDNTRVGEVYRLSLRGLNPDQIAGELGVGSSGFVSNNRSVAKAMLEGAIPKGPTMCGQVAARIRKIQGDRSLSSAAHAYLDDLASILEIQAKQTRPTGDRPDTRVHVRNQRAQPSVPARSLRAQVDEAIQSRVGRLVTMIRAEAGIDPDDYYTIASVNFALDAIVRLVMLQDTSRTTKALWSAGLLDLSIEAAVVTWSEDLPLHSDLVDTARGRLAYWRSQ